MKRIVCFGDSNTWGYNAQDGNRFSEDIRWTSILEKLLGGQYRVIEEGLCGRTAVLNDPLFEGLNGYDYIYPCLKSHSPLELVIIMLGTNDTKERINLTSYNIAQGIVRLSLKAYNTLKEDGVKTPKVLIVSPPPIGEGYYKRVGNSMGRECHIKSNNLGKNLLELIKDHPIEFLDLKGLVPMNNIDFMHLDERGHQILSKIIFDKIKNIL